MNITEKKYLIKRIDSIAEKKIQQLYDDSQAATSAIVVLERRDKFDLVIEWLKNPGTAKAKKAKEVMGKFIPPDTPWQLDILQCWTWPEDKKRKKQQRVIIEKFRELQKKVHIEAQKVRDEIMLGDSAKAMKMLEAFQNKKF